MLLTYIYIIYNIYLDIVPDVPDTSGKSKNNIGLPSGGPKTNTKNMSRPKIHPCCVFWLKTCNDVLIVVNTYF